MTFKLAVIAVSRDCEVSFGSFRFAEENQGVRGGVPGAGGPCQDLSRTNWHSRLSGWVDPSVVGCLEDVTGKTTAGLYVMAGLERLGALLILLFLPRPSA